MSITAGALSLVSVSSTSASLSATAATGGTAPYTYQWYRSTTSGFSPGSGNLIAGATSLSFVDTGLIPLTQYYYKVIATDSVPATVTYTQLAVATTVSTLSQNQFAQVPYVGMLDLRFNYDTISAQIDLSQPAGTPLFPGAAVKIVNSPDGAPKVIGCVADTDEVFGFINYDVRDQMFIAGSLVELSQAGNVLYLYATGAIARGAQVTLDITTMGGVSQIVGSSGANIVGWALDQAPAAGALIRVKLSCPSYAFA